MKEYTVTIGGLEHTVQLSDEDAERQGLEPNVKASPAPKNKSRTASADKADGAPKK